MIFLTILHVIAVCILIHPKVHMKKEDLIYISLYALMFVIFFTPYEGKLSAVNIVIYLLGTATIFIKTIRKEE
jgi:hypothetical protein